MSDQVYTSCPTGKNDAFKIELPYFSKIKFSASRVASGVNFIYTLTSGTKSTAFSYGRGDPKIPAGFTTADGNASDSDTNIAKAKETIAGESMEIKGFSVMAMPMGTDGAAGATGPDLRLVDDRLLAALFSLVNVKVRLNVRGQLDFGFPLLMPGGGGIHGRAARLSSFTALAGDASDSGYPSNGFPVKGNSLGLEESIWWNATGADSLYSMEFTVDRNINLWSGGDVDNKQPNVVASNLPGAVATGTPGYTYPSVLMAELAVVLHGKVWGERSRVI